MLLPATLILIALVIVWYAVRLRRHTGLPWSRIVASDTGAGQPLQRPLFSKRYGLTGKPDYILERGRYLIPVEVKPGRHAEQPYDSDLMQLAAYCLLVEEVMDCTPPYGLLRYATTSFRLPYTPAVRARLLDVLDTMRDILDSDDCARSHNDARRCRSCGFVTQCEEALIDSVWRHS